MTDETNNKSQEAHPDPRLRSLDKLVGTWKLKHRDLETGEKWSGRDTFEWMDGGFFLAFHHEEFGRLKGLMIIGYETRWEADKPSEDILGHWFESSPGNHFIYIWEVNDKAVTSWLEHKDSGMAFRGTFSDDYETLSGVWKWSGGGYELVMTKGL
jgi:hypothetical protein